MPRYNFFGIYHLLGSLTSQDVGKFIWGKFHSLLLQIFLLFLSLLLLLLFPLYACYTFCSCSSIIILSCFFFSLFSLCFSVFEISTSSEILSSAMFSLLISLSKTVFISVAMLLILRLSFWFFPGMCIPLLTLLIGSCMLHALPIRALTILFLVVLKYGSDVSSSKCHFLSFGMSCKFFLHCWTHGTELKKMLKIGL